MASAAADQRRADRGQIGQSDEGGDAMVTRNASDRDTIGPMNELTPRQVVAELDKYIVGQADAKRAVAVAVRNRRGQQQLPRKMGREVSPTIIGLQGPPAGREHV